MLSELWLTDGGAPYKGSALFPLIEQEAWMLWSRDKNVATLHFWRHRQALLLGSRDASLPDSQSAIEALCENGYAVAVRAFGGLAVALDEGVLNVTLILPGAPALDDAFAFMAGLLHDALAPFVDIRVGEIAGSYCPGRYDMSVAGYKIIGIAQRRIAGVIAVSAFVNVQGSSRLREEAVMTYYATACPSSLRDEGRWSPPDVWLGSTASMNDLMGEAGFTVTQCQKAIVSAAAQRTGMPIHLAPALQDDYRRQAEIRLRRGRYAIDWWKA